MLWRHDRVSIEAMPDLTLRQIEGFNVASFEDNTPRADEVRETLVRVFMHAKRGELAPATPGAWLTVESARELGAAIAAPIAKQFAETAALMHQRFDEHGERIGKLESRIDQFTRSRRREISSAVRAEHVRAVRLFGGYCPCCAVTVIATEAELTGEFDHFFAAQAPDAAHTWMICKACHADFTYGRTERTARTPEFGAYQNRLKRLPGAQACLPGLA